MKNLRENLIAAFKQGNFLKVVYDYSLAEQRNQNNLAEELVKIHNEGLIDVVSGFRALQNKPATGIDFFLTRYIFEVILPRIKSTLQPVMDCVLYLVNEAGHDMAAGTLFEPFIEFCAADPSRPKESLKQIETSIEQFANLLAPTIIAGSRIDAEHYLNEAIRLTDHENIEIRKRAVFSLGKIQYPQGSTLHKLALVCLEHSVSRETDDQILGNLIKSAFSLYKHDKSLLDCIVKLINTALTKGEDYSLHAASELFGFNFTELPETLLDSLLSYLLRVSPKNKGTLDNIDYGLVKLIKREDSTKGIEFLEALLIASPNDVSLDKFDSVISAISENSSILNRLQTRWFLRGNRVLCEGIATIINTAHDNDMLLEIDQSELISTDRAHIVFIARKAIGYLFLKPVTAVSIIISLMHHTNDDEDVLQHLADLCFDPLLLNFPGKVKDYLIQQTESRTGKVKTIIEAVLKKYEKYIADLKSTGVISELHPSQAQRDTYRRHFSRLMSKSLKEAEKNLLS